MNRTTKARIGVAGAGAIALSILATLPAHADYAPGPNDIVAVGGDTPQYDLAFAADGDAKGDLGFNASSPVNKLVTFNATADANARAAYVNGTSTGLNPTDVLRAGTKPVQRVPSSGAAINALLADTTAPYTINFVFSASPPTAAQQQAAADPAPGVDWDYLHVVQIGKDTVEVAGDKTTDAPAGLSIAELLSIYKGDVTTWNKLPNNSGGSTATIIPELPPTSSAIYKTFVADLKIANGGTAPTLSNPNIVQAEQNDPSAITGAVRPADAILPFSSARLNLDESGYFRNPATSFPGGAGVVPEVKALTGTTTDSAAAYTSEVDHYVIFRQTDLASKTPMEPGGTLNWANTLFVQSSPSAPTPFIESAAGQANIAAAGTTPFYDDKGDFSVN